MTEYDDHLVDDPASFLKSSATRCRLSEATSHSEVVRCPDCHRTTTVSMTMMLDGDVRLKCEACGATAIAIPLNESPRTYE